MYEGLRTNIPSDLMSFRDAPFKEGTPLFPDRAAVLEYLASFADQIGMREHTRFSTRVTGVERVATSPSAWQVTSVGPQGPQCETFDHVAIASGWCSVPHIPLISGLEHFRGEQWHSAWYRTPTIFRDKTVLVVGNFSSGTDIARELCGGSVRTFKGSEAWQRDTACEPPKTGVTVYQSYLDPSQPPPLDYDPRDAASPAWCQRIHVVGPIDHVQQDGTLVLRGGEELRVDVIVWATGFWRTLPFVDHSKAPFAAQPLVAAPGTTVAVDDTPAPKTTASQPDVHGALALTNLDDWQIFYEPDPSLALLGVPTHIIPFPLSQVQARTIAARWAGLCGPLPQLAPRLAPSDPARWSTREAHDEPQHGVALMSHLIPTPAEEEYVDELIALMPGDEGRCRAPWDVDAQQRGREGWHMMSHWRRDRLQKRILLRRQMLGY